MVCRLLMGRARVIGLLAAGLGVCVIAGGCTLPNPAFDQRDQHTEDADGMSTTAAETTSDTAAASGSGTDGSGESESGLETDDTSDSDTSDSGSLTGGGPQALLVPASFAACRGTTDYSPAQCADFAGGGQIPAIVIDEASDAGDYLVACMSFTLDGTLAGKIISGVILEMHTLDASWAGGDNAGEIWAVEPFTMADFDVALPLRLGAMSVAPSSGSGQINKPVHWSLPIDVVTENAQIYLCAYPLSGDGIYFYSHAGLFPPTLYIDYE